MSRADNNEMLFSASTPAVQAVKLLLQQHLLIMRANEQGARDGLNAECLHDYRVAVRRARSILQLVNAVFPQRTVKSIKKSLSWLGAVTGPARDVDVFLLTFDCYRAQLPSALQPALEPLNKLLLQKQQQRHRAVSRVLGSKRYKVFVARYCDFLHSSGPRRTTLLNARRPIKVVSDEKISKAFKRVLRDGEKLAPGSIAEEFHVLRKTCKKLRYLLEFFRPLYGSDLVGEAVNALKKLQDSLGEFNDLQVQKETLNESSIELGEKRQLTRQADDAIALLVAHLEARQKQKQVQFFEQFRHFHTDEVKDKFRCFSA